MKNVLHKDSDEFKYNGARMASQDLAIKERNFGLEK
jgi:hypothetical protein